VSGSVFHIDYETRSTIPLDERGFHNYITHPTTEVVLCAYAEGDHKVKLWEPHLGEMPPELRDALSDPWLMKAAWNSTFERGITKYVLGVDIPVDEWTDPMASARYMSLPGSLGDVSQILGLKEDTAKIKDGKRLIGLFCEPAVQESSGLFGDTPAGFRDWSTNPEDWALFGEYCRRDVEAERAIHKKLRRFPIPESELRVWKMDQKVNGVGIPVDQTLVKGAQHIADIELAQLRVKLKAITGLENTNSNEQFLAWVATQGFTFSSIGKAFVARAMSGECDLTDAAKEALEIRKMTSKSSVNKFKVIADNMNEDGRLRHQFVYYGASRTGRFSGRDAQFQNLPRPTKEVEKNMDRAVELVRLGDYDAVVKEFTHPLDVVTSTIRAGFRAPDGYHLTVADLSSIESIVIGYVARCESILDIFRNGRDPYLTFGARFFNKPYDEVTKDERQKAKAPVLGCGFGLGGGEEKETPDGDLVRTGLWGYAKALHIDLTQEEAHQSVKVFREMYPEVVTLWKDMQDAAIDAIRKPGTLFEVGPVAFEAVGKSVLRLLLPSGRHLYYIKPKVDMVEHEGKFGAYTRPQISYEGREQGTRSWSRIRAIGSKFCENAVQAIARDIMVHGMLLADEAGFEVVAHVHDELVTLVKDDSPLTLDKLVGCMTVQPAWTGGGLPLKAEGFCSSYYKK
jgi:DNA polymerase bacteriophage-type